MNEGRDYIVATWPAPANVIAGTSLRAGGISASPFDSNNMGDHVGDDPESVERNRLQLASSLGEELKWQWLNQTHSTDVVSITQAGPAIDADAVYTNVPGSVCCVMTADCLPIFITDQSGSEVGIVHAGWRGLAGGVLENAVARFSAPAEQLVVYSGPAIGPCHFEVGEDVRAAFSQSMPVAIIDSLFKPRGGAKFLADLYGLAGAKLDALGIDNYYHSEQCTVCDSDRFFSFRRDGVTGRMVNFIYLAS